MAEKRSYVKDSYIFYAGDVTVSMGVVLNGSVLLIQEDIWGRRNMITKAERGETFAVSFAASFDTPMNLNAVAEKNCEILLLNINHILTMCPAACSYHTRIVKNLVSVLAKKTLVLNEKITHMSKKTTKEKLLSYLSAESIRQKKLEFNIPYDRQQLADFLCVERAAMSAELSKLKKQGILKCEKNHFILCTDEMGD